MSKNNDILDHVGTGELKLQANGDYFCTICSSTLGVQPMPHIVGSSHRNKTFNAVIRGKSTYQKLWLALPQPIRKNIDDGTIKIDTESICCTVCNIKLGGETPMLDHIKSNSHIRKKSLNNTSRAIRDSDDNPRRDDARALPPLFPSSSKTLYDSIPMKVNLPQTFDDDTPLSPLGSPPVPDDEVEWAISKGFLSKVPDTPDQYHCNACDCNISGRGNCIQHLQSERHLKKLKAYFDGKKLKSPTSNPSNSPVYSMPSPPAQPSLSNDSVVYLPVPRKHLMSALEISPDKGTYMLPKGSKGLVVVFNYIFRNQPDSWYRSGASFDSAQIESVLIGLGFKVLLFEDLTKQRTFEELQKIITSELVGMGSFLLFFLSHGDVEKGVNNFYSADRMSISVQDIRRLLTDTNCPAMNGKPKIAFYNFCRGDFRESKSVFSYDSVTQLQEGEIPQDYAVVHAAQDGIKAARLLDGTIFISSLCEVLKEHAKNEDLTSIVNRTAELMKQRHGTTAYIELVLFKKKFFFDG